MRGVLGPVGAECYLCVYFGVLALAQRLPAKKAPVIRAQVDLTWPPSQRERSEMRGYVRC